MYVLSLTDSNDKHIDEYHNTLASQKFNAGEHKNKPLSLTFLKYEIYLAEWLEHLTANT